MPTYLFLIMPAVVDFLLEKFHLYANVEIVRYSTGLILGVALIHLLILSVAIRDQKSIDKNSKIPNSESRRWADQPPGRFLIPN